MRVQTHTDFCLGTIFFLLSGFCLWTCLCHSCVRICIRVETHKDSFYGTIFFLLSGFCLWTCLRHSRVIICIRVETHTDLPRDNFLFTFGFLFVDVLMSFTCKNLYSRRNTYRLLPTSCLHTNSSVRGWRFHIHFVGRETLLAA